MLRSCWKAWRDFKGKALNLSSAMKVGSFRRAAEAALTATFATSITSSNVGMLSSAARFRRRFVGRALRLAECANSFSSRTDSSAQWEGIKAKATEDWTEEGYVMCDLFRETDSLHDDLLIGRKLGNHEGTMIAAQQWEELFDMAAQSKSDYRDNQTMKIIAKRLEKSEQDLL
jgi:hypothetical protein